MTTPVWTFHGSAAPGEEHHYESHDGIAQVFPHPDSGWELQINGSDDTTVFPSAEAAFAAYAPCTMLRGDDKMYPCGAAATVIARDGSRFCDDCATWGL